MKDNGAMRVLIAEDDEDIASALGRFLRREGYEPAPAHDGASALSEAEGCDAAIVDMMLGQDRGEDLVRTLRARGFAGPVLMLSALSDVSDRTSGLAAGADDYIAKPFEFSELLARLKVQEARREAARTEVLRIGSLAYHADRRVVEGGARRLTLTEREGALLAFLIARAEQVVSRGEIFDALWAIEGGSSENVVDVYIGYIRRKLAPMDSYGVALRTIRARGFMLTEETDV